jgi:RimJ/RimL family protein N-acetyltransferase
MTATERIETARLVLRRPHAADAAAIFARYASDPEVTRFVGWPRHASRRDTEAFLRFSAREWARWPAGPYLILSRSAGELLGSTGLAFERADEATTGYVLARDVWGRGFATEALHAMVDLAAGLGVVWLRALCHPAHRASSHVLEKCGFRRDANWTTQVVFPNIAPGVLQDAACYVLALEPGVNRARGESARKGSLA